MAFTNRHAPDDTAIKQEALTENIDVRGVGRYYPEEYSGPIQAAKQRGDILADIPKSLAGIVLNYNEHALSSWQTEQEVQLHDKATVRDLLYKNRKQQMELSTDLELYDARKELESQIFQARKRVANLGGYQEEQAVNEVIESFKDKFQGRLIPDQKWQGMLQQIGSESLARARQADIKSDNFLALKAIDNEFNEIYHSVIGMQQNPDGTFAPIMDIKTGMDEFIKRISPLVSYTNELDRVNALQTYFNAMVQGQAQALVELYRNGQLGADALMTQLESLRTEYGSLGSEGFAKQYGSRKSWTFTDSNGQALKNADGKDMSIELTLGTDTELFLIKSYNDAKSGVGNGGDKIVDAAIQDFKDAVDWDTIQNQGWSEKLLAFDTPGLRTVFSRQIVNIATSTANDDKKIKDIKNLYDLYNTCHMIISTKELINQLGPNALKGIYQVVNNIENQAANHRDTFSWKDYNGIMNINGQDYTLDLAPMGMNTENVLRQNGIDINLISPKLGSSNEEAALYWQKTGELLKKYATYMEKNNTGEILNVTNPHVRQLLKDATGLITPSQIFTYDKNRNITGYNEENRELFKNTINTIIANEREYETRKHIPASTFEEINTQLDKITNIPNNIQAKRFVVEGLERTQAAGDLYTNAYECMQNNKNDGGLFSMSALITNPTAYNAYLHAAENGYTTNNIKEEELNKIPKLSQDIKSALKIPEQDYNLYKDLEQWCILAAYNPKDGIIDQTLFKSYFKGTLENQYIDLNNTFFKNLKGNAFDNTLVYRNHPALLPYANNMQRLQNIGTTFKNRVNNSVPSYLKDTFKDVVLTPDMETGMWYMTKKGGQPFNVSNERVGMVFDSSKYIDKGFHNVDNIIDISVGGLVSALSFSHYDDYANQPVFKDTYGKGIGFVPAKAKPMSEKEFTTRHAALFKLCQDPVKVQKVIDKYEKNRKQEGAIKSVGNINEYIRKNIGEY